VTAYFKPMLANYHDVFAVIYEVLSNHLLFVKKYYQQLYYIILISMIGVGVLETNFGIRHPEYN